MLDRWVSTHVPASNAPKGQGKFLVRCALLPGRVALSPDPPVHRYLFQPGSDRTRGTFALSGIPGEVSGHPSSIS